MNQMVVTNLSDYKHGRAAWINKYG